MSGRRRAGCAGGAKLSPALPLVARRFDYRTFHRGLANRAARVRPVLYTTLARPGRADAHNFPADALADPPLLLQDTVEPVA